MDTTLSTLSPYDIAALVRAKVKRSERSDRFEQSLTPDNSRISLICTITEMWPKCKKKRSLRLNVIMALLGRPVMSQGDIFEHETKAMLEVLRDDKHTRICFDDVSRGSLQEHLEGKYFGRAWTFPYTQPMSG